MTTIAIRIAETSDVPDIARLHVASWHESYRGILPEETLRGLDAASRATMWRSAMTDGHGGRDIVLAERLAKVSASAPESGRGEAIGFASCGEAWDTALGVDGEIEAVYVLNRFQYRGIGTRLMGALGSAMLARGMNSAGLWVARDNLAALAFYRALGGIVIGTYVRPLAGLSLPAVGVVWPDLSELALWNDPEPGSRRPYAPAEGDAQSRRAVPRKGRLDECCPA